MCGQKGQLWFVFEIRQVNQQAALQAQNIPFLVVKRAFAAGLVTTKLQLQKFCTSAYNSKSNVALRQQTAHKNC
jgi:hypothetical protein